MKRFINILVILAVALLVAWIVFNFVIKIYPQVSTILGILTICVSLTGFVLLQRDIHLSNSQRIVLASMPLLAIIVIGTYWLEHTLGINWFPEAIVAWGTLLLAIATFRLAETSREENAKLVEENKLMRTAVVENDNRDRQLKSLDEVIEWVQEINDLVIMKSLPVTPDTKVEYFSANATARFSAMIGTGIYMHQFVSSMFGNDLGNKVKNVCNELLPMAYVWSKTGGITTFEQSLIENPKTLELIKKDKKALDEGEKTPSQLLKEHSFNLAQSLTELVLNIAEEKTKLLKM